MPKSLSALDKSGATAPILGRLVPSARGLSALHVSRGARGGHSLALSPWGLRVERLERDCATRRARRRSVAGIGQPFMHH